VWLAESRDAAVAHAYTYEVLGPVKVTMEEGGEIQKVYLSEINLQQAGKLAQLRAAAGGKRLATIWKVSLPFTLSDLRAAKAA
jgi:hypothetical protein